jgi:hypothetical protein
VKNYFREVKAMAKLDDAGMEKLTITIPTIVYAALIVSANKRRLRASEVIAKALIEYFKIPKSAML